MLCLEVQRNFGLKPPGDLFLVVVVLERDLRRCWVLERDFPRHRSCLVVVEWVLHKVLLVVLVGSKPEFALCLMFVAPGQCVSQVLPKQARGKVHLHGLQSELG